MPAPWTPDLGVYPAMMDDHPAVMSVDLAAGAHAPVATHPLFFGLRIALQRPRDDGLSSSDEADALAELHDRLEAELVDAADAIFVARYITDGHLFLAYYVPAEPRRSPNVFDGYEPYTPEPTMSEDPDWKILAEIFTPDEWQTMLISNGRLMSQLASMGDKFSSKRSIDHAIVLPSEEAHGDLIAQLEHRGYRIDAVHDEDGATWVNFSKIDDLSDPLAFTKELFDLAGRFGGIYDGWATPICQ